MEEKRFFNVEDIAKYLGVSPSTIRNWARDGKLRHRRIGKFIRFTLEDVEAFIIKST